MTAPYHPSDLLTVPAEARRINAANGWGVDFTYAQVPTFLALIHSEVTETDLDRPNRMAMANELADVIIRAADLGELLMPGRLGAHFSDATREDWAAPVAYNGPVMPERLMPDNLLRLHSTVSAMLEDYRKKGEAAPTLIVAALASLIAKAVSMTRALGYCPADLVAAKLAVNAQRGHRHGGLLV